MPEGVPSKEVEVSVVTSVVRHAAACSELMEKLIIKFNRLSPDH